MFGLTKPEEPATPTENAEMPAKKAELYRMADAELVDMAVLWGHDREAVMELAGVDRRELVDLVWADLNRARLEAEAAPAGLTEADRVEGVRSDVLAAAEELGSVVQPSLPGIEAGEIKMSEVPLGAVTVEGLSRAVAYLAQAVQDMKHDRDGRLKTVEKKVDQLEKAKRSAETTHGSIDNLGSIDDLTVGKIAE